MQDYDATLKSFFRHLAPGVLKRLTGYEVSRWHNVELPSVQTRSLDLLGETPDGRLIHIELQSGNDPDMSLRMAEYAIAIYRNFRKRPEQVVLYIGDEPLRMPNRFWEFECRMMDVRDIEGKELLDSDRLKENVFAILLRLEDQREALRRVLQRIISTDPHQRSEALAGLLVLARLRKLGEILKEEAEKMPILIDWDTDAFVGPMLRKKRDEALLEGKLEGQVEGERRLLLRLIEERFGTLPEWAGKRLDKMTLAELESTGSRFLAASSLEDLLH